MKRVLWRMSLGMLIVVLLAAGAAIALDSAYVSRAARKAIVERLEQSTGARVELGAFQFHFLGLRADLSDLTLHGREQEGLPPLLHADHIRVALHIRSLFGRKISLSELDIDRPEVFVRIAQNGQSNVPSPPVRRPGKPWRQQLFDLEVARLALSNGTLEFNDARSPLAAEVHDFQFAMDYVPSAPGGPSYIGRLGWNGMEMAARRYLPFLSDLSMRFTLSNDSFAVDELRLKLPNSDFQVRAVLSNFSQPSWNVHYRGRFSFDDLRTILRKPGAPTGVVDFTGAAHSAGGQWSSEGHYRGSEIALNYTWFHRKDIESWGDFQATPAGLDVPKFGANVLDGTLAGHLEFDFHTQNFRVQSQGRGISLAATLAALDNPSFPMHALHWNGAINVDSVTTWHADFKHFRTTGTSKWLSPLRLGPRQIPATAQIGFDYSMDRADVMLSPSQITTPSTQLDFSGSLGKLDSALEVRFQTRDLLVWDDFINTIRGPEAEPHIISGQALWTGRVLGPIVTPTFAGQVHVLRGRYARLSWDELEGTMSYSPDELRLSHMKARHGASAIATLDLWLQFDGDWSFLPSNQWSLDAVTYRSPIDTLQDFFGLAYPIGGLASGDVRASGTRADTAYEANFIIDDGNAQGFRFDRFSGQFGMKDDEIRISHAELHKGPGHMTGDILYHPAEKDVAFHVSAAAIPLESIQKIQTPALPVAGLLTFDVQGQGPLLAPNGQGTLQVTRLKLGNEEQGDFLGRLNSDGTTLTLDIDSLLTKGSFDGRLDVALNDGFPVSGQIQIAQFDLDPLIEAGLHLKELTGHSSIDGKFRVSGKMLEPDTIEADAELARVSFGYEYVKLENVNPVRLSYRRNLVLISQAEFRGPATDLSVSGNLRFDGQQPLNVSLSGSVDLRLAAGFVPGLESTGAAQLDVGIQGTMSRPRITGRAQVADSALHYREFPTGLSHVDGQFLFTRNQLLFDNVSAEAGGGAIKLSGSLTFGDLPIQYQVNVTAPRVLIRYPTGVSWLAGGKLQLTGNTEAGLLSGNVQLERLLLSEGVDIASVFGSSSESSAALSGPGTSPYLRNLQFDVAGTTTANARIEWPQAHVEIDGDVHLRGTWDRPLLLGHVHLLSGEMAFHGNNYRLTRGDVNFSNPFRLDPILNVEATANISQYQVTIDFTGPASRLTLSYRSDPPLPDSDIVALLALGTPGAESALRSSTSGSQNYGATALLSEAISSQLGGRIEHLFGITNFRVDPFLAGTTTEQNAAARVTIEKQVTRDLVVTYSSNATSNQYQVIQVEYSVRRDTSIVFLRDINDTYSFTVELRKHFH